MLSKRSQTLKKRYGIVVEFHLYEVLGQTKQMHGNDSVSLCEYMAWHRRTFLGTGNISYYDLGDDYICVYREKFIKLYIIVHNSFICNSAKLGTTQMAINR